MSRSVARRRALLLALPVLTAAAAAHATDPETLALPGPLGAAADVTASGREVVLRFPRPVDDRLRGALVAQAGHGLVDAVEVAFDSALVTLTVEADVAVARSADGGTLTMVPHDMPQPATAPSRAEQRLRLIAARAAAQTGDAETARRLLDEAHQENPSDAEPLIALGALARSEGQWRESENLYEQAATLDPRNEETQAALAEIGRDQGPRLRLDIDARSVKGGESDVQETLLGWAELADGWRTGLIADVLHLDVANVRHGDGPLVTFQGFRERGEAYLQKDLLDGEVARLRLFAGTRDAGGVGGEWWVPDADGRTAVRAEWNYPDWSFTEGRVAGATRDRLGVGRSQRLGDAQLSLDLSVNRYGIDGHEAARALTLAGTVQLPIPSVLDGGALAYSVDGEYPWRVASRIAGDGSIFHPLPDVHREVHALSLVVDRQLLEPSTPDHALSVEASAGAGIDRFGRAGPILGLGAVLDEGPWQARLRATHERHIGRNGETVTGLGASLLRLF